jgi:hypothetical protein
MKKLLMVMISLVVLSCLAWAGTGTWSGTVSDSNCGAKHEAGTDADVACVKTCVEKGAKYVLAIGGKVYQVEPQAKYKDHAGHKVKVTGKMEGDTITAEMVAM